tara:strand:+ start:38 stop:706 length:669 start_codon:yes stop_codon:yes gene_type:complete
MTNKAIPIITIDGPSASGKGTISSKVAEILGFTYLDSGIIYRLVALETIYLGASLDDEKKLISIAKNLETIFVNNDVEFSKKISNKTIREEKIALAASKIAIYPLLRHSLIDLQRKYKKPPGLVADGRDMGTKIFPEACLKVYLSADLKIRAKRRYKQLIEKGFSANMSDLLNNINTRDSADKSRGVSALRPAVGARVIDSSKMEIDEVVHQVLGWYYEISS